MKKTVTRFEKNGIQLEAVVDIDERPFQLYLSNGKVEVPVLRIVERSGGFAFLINKEGADKLLGQEFPKKYVCLRTDDAKQAEEAARHLWSKRQEERAIEAYGRLTDTSEIRMWFSPIHTYVRCEEEDASQYYYFKETSELIRTVLDEGDITNLLGRAADDVILRDVGLTWMYILSFGEYKRLVEFAKKREKAKERGKKKRERDLELKLQSAFDLAKELGEPVVLDHYLDDCDDPGRDCDLDIVTKYALPDGTIKIQRTHTD